MSRCLHVTLAPAAVKPSRAIAQAARLSPLLVLTHRTFNDLAAELGSDHAAMRHLLRVSGNVGRPIGCNFETGTGSRTVFLAPHSWTPERLQGWVAGKHQEIADAFGPAVPLPVEDL